MIFKNKFRIQYKYLLIYLSLILQTQAAKPFRSNIRTSITTTFGNTNRYGSLNRPSTNIGHTFPKHTSANVNSISNRNFGGIKPQNIAPSRSVNTQPLRLGAASNKPLISIADSKLNLRNKNEATYNSRKKNESPRNIDATLTKERAFDKEVKLPTAPNFNASAIRQPAYNPNYKNRVSKNATMNTNFNFTSPMNIKRNVTHLKTNNTGYKKTSAIKQAKISHNSENRTIIIQSSMLRILGYPTSTIHRHNILKTQHNLNRELTNRNKSTNYAKNQIIIIVMLLIVIVTIVIGIIVYTNLKY